MCLVKTPKVNTAATTADNQKPLPIIRNPLLDGFDPTGALRIGRKSLRVDKAPATAATAPSTMLSTGYPTASRI